MSHVSPQEIIALTAEAFGVTIAEMTAPMPRMGGACPLSVPRYAARCCAIMLIRRHTLTSGREIQRLLAMRSRHVKPRTAEVLGQYAARNPDVARKVERIETRIDDLHERRFSARQLDLENAIQESHP